MSDIMKPATFKDDIEQETKQADPKTDEKPDIQVNPDSKIPVPKSGLFGLGKKRH